MKYSWLYRNGEYFSTWYDWLEWMKSAGEVPVCPRCKTKTGSWSAHPTKPDTTWSQCKCGAILVTSATDIRESL